MPKKIEWINGNKMRFESKHKTFNRQTNIISTGNIIANTEYGGFIRAHNEVINPVGEKREPGFLQDFDLRPFKESLGISYPIEKKVKEYLKEKAGILYCFFHYSRGKRIIDGYVLTDTDHNYIEFWYRNQHWRSNDAIKEALKYIANGPEEGLGYGETRGS